MNNMRIMFIGGDHPRHLYYINKIQDNFEIAGAIIQHRENISLTIPENLSEEDKKNFIRHFKTREKKEIQYFKNPELPKCDIHDTTAKTLNSIESVEFLKEIKPNLVLIFGSTLIKNPLYSVLPPDSINFHLGISPRYRGAATLFWPFYFLEPNYAGSTFHYIISEPDAGNIIHQCTPKLSIGDGIHDVACKTVITSTDEMIKLLEIKNNGKVWKNFEQTGTGKNFLMSDFKPEHLRVIYTLFDDKLVDEYLQDNIYSKNPNLIRQF